jgi:dihydrofolate synthase/folylpolyglutamate synthase
MTYSDALRWLYARNQFSIKLGLEATRALLDVLGNPERGGNYLHVAGTNGKGSVCANLAALIGSVEGGPVGLYTSPHLVSFRERIRVDGKPIPEQAVADWMNASLPRLEALNPTYFECVTALALEWFRRAGCRAAVLETGLGGRLDATNVVTPRISVITSISLDHTALLGDTLEAVQGEKLGIVKPGVPVVVDEPREGLARRAGARARALNAPFLNLAGRLEEGDEAWTVRGAHRDYRLPADLRAEPHQMRNAALSVLAFEAWRGVALPPEAEWLPALRAARVPGRTQWLAPKRESSGLMPVLLDGAHNPAGVEALRAALARRPGPGSRARVFFAVMRDKEFLAVHRTLRALTGDLVYVDLAAVFPRALTAAELAEELRAETAGEGSGIREAPLSWEGLAPLLRAGSGADYAVFCGSLFLLGEAIPLLMEPYAGLEEFEELAREKAVRD